MAILDVSQIYTNTGDILQINYAQKSADNGNTCICLKNKKGVVMIVEKPIESNLYISEKDNKIKKVTDSIFQVASGIETDLWYVNKNLKERLVNEKNDYELDISFENYRSQLVDIIHIFTRYNSARPLGINILSMIKYKDEYKICKSDSSGKSVFYKSTVIGKGSRIVKTELEKLNIEELDIKNMVKNAIRILYKSYDPLKDKPFDIEVGIMADETNGEFIRLKHEEYAEFIEQYKDYSVDGED